MTIEQYQRWQDFALRMALHAWPEWTQKRKERLREEVGTFFSSALTEEEAHEVTSWDSAPAYPCDRITEFYDGFHVYSDQAERTGKFYFIDAITCCIRAGLDVAGKPSAGVVGFDVGMLRRMYDGEIPDWIDAAYQGKLATAPDDTEVWL